MFSPNNGPDAFFDVPPFSMFPKSNVQVHNKMISALAELNKQGTNHPVARKVVEALYRKVEFDDTARQGDTEPVFPPFNQRLYDSQLEAILFALSSKRPLALIHGQVYVFCCCAIIV
jgi:hypothetical protein